MPVQRTSRKQLRIPSLRRCNGRGFVELSGRRHYLGPWNAAETKEAYRRAIAEWLESGRRLSAPSHRITVVELCDRFYEHAKEYYRGPDGESTRSLDHVREAIRMLCLLYGRTSASEFGPLALRAIRAKWIENGLARSTINSYVRNVRMLFKWGVSRELVDANVIHALSAVEGLRQGRSNARDTEPVRPAPPEAIEMVKKKVSRQVAALIDLQLLTAARPGEVVGLRPCDIVQSGDVWTVNLQKHKTAYAGRQRVLHLGPRAQALLRPFLLRSPDKPLFSPKEAEAQRHAQAESHRRPGQKPNRRITDRHVGDAYTVCSYNRAIARVCRECGIESWSPHQLRHTAATQIRRQYGLDAAQAVLGHANADITQVYAELDMDKAVRIAKEVG